MAAETAADPSQGATALTVWAGAVAEVLDVTVTVCWTRVDVEVEVVYAVTVSTGVLEIV